MNIIGPNARRDPRIGLRRLFDDIGDRLCCVAIVLAGLAGFALVAWYVASMPALR